MKNIFKFIDFEISVTIKLSRVSIVQHHSFIYKEVASCLKNIYEDYFDIIYKQESPENQSKSFSSKKKKSHIHSS